MNGTGTNTTRTPVRLPDGFVRETFRLPRDEARAKARAWLDRWPRAAYWSEVEAWQIMDGDDAETIEFTMRRLPTAD